MQSTELSSRTETRDDRQETVIGRDKLEYASLTDVLLGEPLPSYRNASIRTKRSHGWTEEAIDSWIAWLNDGREKGHLTKNGVYIAAKIAKEPAKLPPPGPKGIDDVIGVDFTGAKGDPIFKCNVDTGLIGLDEHVERRQRREQLLYAAGRREPF